MSYFTIQSIKSDHYPDPTHNFFNSVQTETLSPTTVQERTKCQFQIQMKSKKLTKCSFSTTKNKMLQLIIFL